MSQYFLVKDAVLWNPSTAVARLFARSVDAVAPAEGLPTGVGPEFNDQYEINVVVFVAFVDALVRRYSSSTHLILRTLIEGVAAVGIVMVERAGATVVSLTERPTATDGAVGDPARLRDLANELERAMPR